MDRSPPACCYFVFWYENNHFCSTSILYYTWMTGTLWQPRLLENVLIDWLTIQWAMTAVGAGWDSEVQLPPCCNMAATLTQWLAAMWYLHVYSVSMMFTCCSLQDWKWLISALGSCFSMTYHLRTVEVIWVDETVSWFYFCSVCLYLLGS